MKFSRIFLSTSIFSIILIICPILMGASRHLTSQSISPSPQEIESIEFLTCGNPSIGTSNPSKSCATEIEKYIELAIKMAEKGNPVELDIFVYSMNDWSLICNLNPQASYKGLLKTLLEYTNAKVKIVTDYKQFYDGKAYSRNTLECLKKDDRFPDNFELKLWPKDQTLRDRNYQMHTKTAIFKIGQSKYMVMGSFNWTNGARNRNLENCIIVKGQPDQASIIDNAETQFKSIWANSVPITPNSQAVPQIAQPQLHPSASSTSSHQHSAAIEQNARQTRTIEQREWSADTHHQPPPQRRRSSTSSLSSWSSLTNETE